MIQIVMRSNRAIKKQHSREIVRLALELYSADRAALDIGAFSQFEFPVGSFAASESSYLLPDADPDEVLRYSSKQLDAAHNIGSFGAGTIYFDGLSLVAIEPQCVSYSVSRLVEDRTIFSNIQTSHHAQPNLIGGIGEKFNLFDQKNFWSFYNDLYHSTGYILAEKTIPIGDVFPELSKKSWSDSDLIPYLSSSKIRLIWQEVSEIYGNNFSSLDEISAALLSCLKNKVSAVVTVRSRYRKYVNAQIRQDAPGTRDWLLEFSLHTGVSPPQNCDLIWLVAIFKQERDDVTLWEQSYSRNLPIRSYERRARRGRSKGCSATRHNGSGDQFARSAFCGSRSLVEAAALKPDSLSHSCARKVVDQLFLAHDRCIRSAA